MTVYSGVFSGTLITGESTFGNDTVVDSGTLSLTISIDPKGDVSGSGTLTDTSVITVAEPPQFGNFVATASGTDTEGVGGSLDTVPPGNQVLAADFIVDGVDGAESVEASFGGDFANSMSEITGTLDFSDDNTVVVTLSTQPTLPPIISFDSGSLQVNASEGTATYTLTRGPVPIGDTGSSVLVSTGNGTAVAGTDYDALDNEEVVFAPGQTTATFTVDINPNSTDASKGINPDFSVVLSDPINASIGFGTANTTIIENGDEPKTDDIGSGQTADNLDVASGDTLTVQSGGTAIGTIVQGGGGAFVDAGGTLISGSVMNGGFLVVSGGGTEEGTVISAGGTEIVSSGGVASDTVVYNGGVLIPLPGAIVTGTTPVPPTDQADLVATNDFTGDGTSDVLWQNDNSQDSGTGQTAIWVMDRVTPISEAVVGNVPPSWHAVATGDFFDMGDADILWQNDNGQVAIWDMNGTTPTAENVIATPPADWHAVATGDFNGDGRSDILWQYEDTANSSDSQNGNVAIWEVNGGPPFVEAAEAVVAVPGPDWVVVGTGDFNGDGKSDILWQYKNSQNASDPQNGNVAIWEMNGLTPTATAVIAQPGADWHAVGTGDFNGDGKADILWQYENGQNASDPQNGTTAIWLMNGLTPTAEAVIANPGAAWHAIGTGDYDGNGKSDILWQNTNGQAAIWEMNGLTPTTESVFATPPASWHVIPA